jgi:hypothetical protein
MARKKDHLFTAVLSRAFLDARTELKPRKPLGRRDDDTDTSWLQRKSHSAWTEATARANRDQARAFLTGEAWDGKLDWMPHNIEESDPHLLPFTAAEGNEWFITVCENAGRNPEAVREKALELAEGGWEFGYTDSSAGGETESDGVVSAKNGS